MPERKPSKEMPPLPSYEEWRARQKAEAIAEAAAYAVKPITPRPQAENGWAGMRWVVLALIFSVISYFAVNGIIDKIASVMCK